VELVAKEERRGRAESGDLGKRDVDEDDLPRQHVDAQIGVDAREDETHQERRPQKGQEIAEHAGARRPLSQPVRVAEQEPEQDEDTTER
jgi:hypothetical protein